MQTFAKIEEFYTYKKVTYYSVRIEDDELNETDKFYERFMDDDEWTEEFADLINWIEYIGEVEGASKSLFREEQGAQALPPSRKEMNKRGRLFEIGYNLRIYCIVINEEIVILLNGGVKESQTAQESPDLVAKFRLATKLNKLINDKIISRELLIKNKQITGDFDLFF